MSTNNTAQAFWIAIGSFFAFGFGIVSSMILSRYFPKADYGTYKQVIYVYGTFLSIFTLGLPKAFSYFLPRVKVDQAKSVIKKITNIFFILGAAFSILLFVFSNQIADVLKNPDLGLAIRLFSPVPFLMLPTMGLEGILSTFRMTKFMAIYTVATRVLMLICVALPVIIWQGGYIQAIIGFVIASFITFLLALYFKYLPVKNKGNDEAELGYRQIFQFSLPLLYASLWGMLIKSADQFFISRYFGSSTFAEFSNGAMELPFVGMIIGATSSVLSPVFSRMNHKELDPQKEIFPLWKSVFEKSAKLIYPLVIYAWFFAEVLMVTLYGNKYENSSTFFRIKVVVNFFTLIAYAPLLINIGKVKYYAKVHMYGAVLLIVLEFASLQIYKSPYIITSISVLSQIGRIIIMLFVVARFFNLKISQLFPIRLIAKILLPSILFLSLEYYFLMIFFNIAPILVLILSAFIYGFFYLVYAHFAGMNYLSIVKPLFNKFRK